MWKNGVRTHMISVLTQTRIIGFAVAVPTALEQNPAHFITKILASLPDIATVAVSAFVSPSNHQEV